MAAQTDGAAGTSGSFGNRRFRVGLIVAAIVTVGAVLLVVQNGESARLDWLAFHFRTPLWIMLVLTLVAGAVVWEFVKAGWRRSRQHRHERRTSR